MTKHIEISHNVVYVSLGMYTIWRKQNIYKFGKKYLRLRYCVLVCKDTSSRGTRSTDRIHRCRWFLLHL